MKRLLAASAVLAMLSAAAMAAELEGFQKTYAEAQKLAKESNKPMYLHFTTTWCGWCRKIEKDDYASEEGKKALADFVPASLDCTVPDGQEPSPETRVNLDLMRKFGGRGYPFLVILTPDGDLMHGWAGYKSVDQFVEELKEALKNFQEYKDFQAYAAKADKKTFEYNAKAMTFYAMLKKWDPAAEAARGVRKLDPKDEKGLAATAAFVELQAALAAENRDPQKIKTLLAEMGRLDPQNTKGVLEKAMWQIAYDAFRASMTRDAELRKAKLQEALDTLKDLTSRVEKLTGPQEVYGLMAATLASMGELDEAQKALEKGIAVTSQPEAIEKLKAMLERVKEAKAARSQPPIPPPPGGPPPAEK